MPGGVLLWFKTAFTYVINLKSMLTSIPIQKVPKAYCQC